MTTTNQILRIVVTISVFIPLVVSAQEINRCTYLLNTTEGRSEYKKAKETVGNVYHFEKPILFVNTLEKYGGGKFSGSGSGVAHETHTFVCPSKALRVVNGYRNAGNDTTVMYTCNLRYGYTGTNWFWLCSTGSDYAVRPSSKKCFGGHKRKKVHVKESQTGLVSVSNIMVEKLECLHQKLEAKQTSDKAELRVELDKLRERISGLEKEAPGG